MKETKDLDVASDKSFKRQVKIILIILSVIELIWMVFFIYKKVRG